MHYKSLTIADPAELIFGLAPNPVTTRSGMVIGGGTIYPELNFTLPNMSIDAGTMPDVRRIYQEIITGALRRASDLEVPGVVIEFETLPPMTEHPEVSWFDVMQDTLDDMPDSESEFIDQQLALADPSRFLPEQYGLTA